MFIETAQWGWPQWFILCSVVLSLLLTAAVHGRPKIDEQTKEPVKYNFFAASVKAGVFVFVLTAGGFFRP